MNNQFVSIRYNGRDFLLTGRGDDGKRRTYTITGFEPYFYCDENEEISSTNLKVTGIEYGHKNIYGKNLKKVIATDPKSVRYIRETIKVWEEVMNLTSY